MKHFLSGNTKNRTVFQGMTKKKKGKYNGNHYKASFRHDRNIFQVGFLMILKIEINKRSTVKVNVNDVNV